MLPDIRREVDNHTNSFLESSTIHPIMGSMCSAVSQVDCLRGMRRLYEAREIENAQLKAKLSKLKWGVEERDETVRKLRSRVHDLKEARKQLKKGMEEVKARIAWAKEGASEYTTLESH